MIKNSSVGTRISFRNILGTDCLDDAFDLISKLLVFNPNKRLTANEALEHCYISMYRNKNSEITINRNVIPPLNDDIRLSVDDYRNKLYELMSHSVHSSKSIPLWKHSKIHSELHKKEIVKTHTSPNLTNDLPKSSKDKYSTQSDPKMYTHSSYEIKSEPRLKPSTIMYKSDSKIPVVNRQSMVLPQQKVVSYHRYSAGDSLSRLVSNKPEEKTKKKSVNYKHNVYTAPYNSYNHSHGIITASALRELKSGVR